MKRFMISTLFVLATICMAAPIAEAHYMFDLIKSGGCRVTAMQFEWEGELYPGYTFIYDSGGNLTEVRGEDRISFFRYDASGRVQKMEAYWDGILEDIEYYYYDASGKLTRIEYDWDADGTIDEIEDYIYSSGRLVEIRSRYDDEVSKLKYDAAGKLVEIDEYWYDDLEYRQRFIYDGDGKLQKIEEYDLYDNDVFLTFFTWDCSGSGGTGGPGGGGDDSGGGCFVNRLH